MSLPLQSPTVPASREMYIIILITERHVIFESQWPSRVTALHFRWSGKLFGGQGLQLLLLSLTDLIEALKGMTIQGHLLVNTGGLEGTFGGQWPPRSYHL